MTTDSWHSFLDAQGAQRDERGVRGFTDETARSSSTRLIALENLGYLLVQGPEAKKFLQGQVTCDMNLVTEDHAQPGGHCNTKGRMIFSFRAVELPAESADSCSIALVMQREHLERAREVLGKYIVFSKAELSIGEDYRLLGLAGAQSPSLLSRLLPRIPIASNDAVQTETVTAVRISGDRFLCFLDGQMAQEQWKDWAAHCQPGGYPLWDLANIGDGLGEVMPGCEETFIPQMLNMQVTGGVSFTKGCYVGQEVVARMKYLGKLKRHMRRLEAKSATVPQPGAPLYSPEAAQSVGNVVVAAPAGSGTCELLAVTTDRAFESDALYRDSQCTEHLQPLPLPYAITD